MKRLWIGFAALVAAMGLGALVFAQTRECGAIDIAFGWSGCTGSLTIGGVASLGSTIAWDDNGDLMVLGTEYGQSSQRNRFDVTTQLVWVDWAGRRETRRIALPAIGRFDQLQLSPVDDTFAVSCNTIYVCDLLSSTERRDNRNPSQLALLGAEGSILWTGFVATDGTQPSSEGRAFDLSFSADGAQVLAGSVAFAVGDGAETPRGAAEAATDQATILASDVIEIAGAERSLDLPDDYVPFRWLQTTASPDGKSLATLSRRFAGAGLPRAVLQVWDAETGAVIVRHEINTDLSPALAWQPDGQEVLVATAPPMSIGASTQLRSYGATP